MTTIHSSIRLFVAIAAAAGACSGLAQTSGGGPVEELIVTGTHVQSDREHASSPVHILGADELQQWALPALGEVIAHQTFTYGSSWITNEIGTPYQDGNRTSANLRGLGTSATLLLLNGQRSADDNVNNLYPQIAIDRIETVLNGASAVYGSDAVAGVVNIIPRKTYDGFDLSVLANGDDKGDHTETDLSVLFGRTMERTHLVVAAEYRFRDRLRQRDRPKYLRGGYSYSDMSPVPNVHELRRDPLNGTLLDDFSSRDPLHFHSSIDPGCGVWDGPGGDDPASRANYVSGRTLSEDARSFGIGATCQFSYGEFFEFVAKNRSLNLWGYASHEFNEHLSLEIEALYGRQHAENRGSPSNGAGQPFLLPIIAGEHPGNPFRAMLDTDGDGLLDSPIQAVDGSAFLASNGIADRDCDGNGTIDNVAEAEFGEGNTDCVVIVGGSSSDEDGDGIFDLFDPDFGVAFNEDVALRNYRPLGKLGTLPSALEADGSNIGGGKFHSDNIRASTKLRFFLPSTTWGGSLELMHQRHQFTHFFKNTSLSTLQDGLIGQGGLAHDEYFNPFSTHTFICENRVCRLPAPDGSEDQQLVANTQALMDDIAIRTTDVLTQQLTTVSFTLSGNPMELPAGTLSAALGAEWRHRSSDFNRGTPWNTCDMYRGGCGLDGKADQGITAGFLELFVPVFETDTAGSLEAQVAARYETAGHGLDSFDTRFSGLWRPRDWISVRGAWGTAFIFPTIDQLFAVSAISNEQLVSDVITGDYGLCSAGNCTLLRTHRVTYAGNEDLSPEDASTWNIGLSLTMLSGDLLITFDHTVFNIDNLIVGISPDATVRQDAENYFAAGNTEGDLSDVMAWMCENGGPGDCHIQRDPDTTIRNVVTAAFNSDESLHHVSSDLSLEYRFYGNQLPWMGSDSGSFSISLQGTWVHQYEFDLPGRTGDAAAQQNAWTTSIPPIPRLQAHGVFAWTRGPFSAFWRTRFIGSVEGDSIIFGKGEECTLSDGRVGDIIAGRDITCATHFDSVFYHDVAASFITRTLLGGERTLQLTVGANNVLEKEVPARFFRGGLESLLHDPRGRMLYGRVSVSM